MLADRPGLALRGGGLHSLAAVVPHQKDAAAQLTRRQETVLVQSRTGTRLVLRIPATAASARPALPTEGVRPGAVPDMPREIRGSLALHGLPPSGACGLMAAAPPASRRAGVVGAFCRGSNVDFSAQMYKSFFELAMDQRRMQLQQQRRFC
ncbi:hypothetical protein CGC20_9980 [Leishmania donovani]|uniref:Uncharacterized protein n=1 Tax=Leishmania donovani TaxID=5661 RepID=A0A504Y1S4_LEIDO|nr:hypothetical protein CGC20_9980 [Leishmania donovani]